MRKPEPTGILLQARDRIRKALGVPKHQTPDDPFYTCPFGDEEDVHRVDLDEESGQWYCMDCEAGYEDSKHLFRLDELWREHHLDNVMYEEGKPRPVRKNQKITDGELEEYFGSIEGKYVKVTRLKKMFGPTPDNLDGLIKINDTDSSTTVISSSFMRRLGKITGKKWTQEKAEGEKGENLVRFVQTDRSYIPKKKPTVAEKFENHQAKLDIKNRIFEIENRLWDSRAKPSNRINEDTEEFYTVIREYDFSKIDDLSEVEKLDIQNIKQELYFLDGLLKSHSITKIYPKPNIRRIRRNYGKGPDGFPSTPVEADVYDYDPDEDSDFYEGDL
jgi:hypothetical protein